MGTPAQDMEAGVTRWLPPAELSCLKEGEWLLVIDELPQAEKMMQNALAGLMLDRYVGELHLSSGVRVMATGNRTKDKAGSNRIVSQLGNRVARLEMEVNLDDWVEWALDTDGLDIMGIAFMKARPDALFDFDPDRFSNATPRAWERVMRVDTDMDPVDYHELLCGIVNEGRAAEYVGFKKLLGRMPNIDQIVMDPHGSPVPEDPDVQYACIAALTTRTSKDNFDSLTTYVNRLPVDYQALYMKGAVRQNEQLMATRTFIQWSSANTAVFA